MSYKTLGASLFFVLIGLGKAANAYVDSPRLSPAHPKAGELVKVEIRAGICDGFAGAENSAEVTQVGNHLHMKIAQLHDDDIDWCTLPLEIDYKFWVGRLPAGSYDLTVDTTYKAWYGPEIITTIGHLPFAVEPAGTPVSSVPTVSAVALVVLGLLLSSVATAFLLRHKRKV